MTRKNDALEARRKYVQAFNDTMVKIWKEKIFLLDAINHRKRYPSETTKWPSPLLDSVVAVRMDADDKFLSIEFEQEFNSYGIYVNFGVGREVYKGNPGDIGRDKLREPKKWFSTKYYASMMNLSEFYAENVGHEFAQVMSNALTNAVANRFAIDKNKF